MKKNNLRSDKGITGIDLVTSITLIVIFSGLIIQLLNSIYKISIEIQKSANATAYATIILEKVDEKAYEDITKEFVTDKLKDEISIDSGYNITVNVSTIDTEIRDVAKRVSVKVEYDVNGTKKEITIDKLKIKEISNNG